MAIPHAKPGQPVDVRPLGDRLAAAQTATLVKTDALEVIRLIVPAGKEIPPHDVPGEITVQCLEGKVVFCSQGSETELTGGMLLYLPGSAQHSLRGIEDASLLVTIQLKHKKP